jgi:predicted negative regulator of RcsB-dependent stress response
MAIDYEQQEQLDEFKAFWKKYGNPITWLLLIVLSGLAGWNAWGWWQRDQTGKASAMFDQLEKAAQAGDADQASRVFADMKERYPSTAYTQQAGLLTAKTQFEKGQLDAALTSLSWVGLNAVEVEYKTIAKLRAAGVLLDQKKYDDALKQLDTAQAPDFKALVADRRGDVLMAQGKKDAAKASYEQAWKTMDKSIDYRRIIEAKLAALGAAPPAEPKDIIKDTVNMVETIK